MLQRGEVVLKTKFPELKLFKRGKVRDVYEVEDKLLIVATDRISAFDVVFPNGIPNKGKVLNQISVFWFNYLQEIIPNHLITADVNRMPQILQKYRDILEGRSMLVKRTRPLPIEAVVRGYLAGSGLKEYKQKGSICGIRLPENLQESSKLPEPIFTPSTKVESGHDENISEVKASEIIGDEIYKKVKDFSLKIYKKIADYALSRGIIFADTKFEFGFDNGNIILIDEVGTPDSSRFWSVETYKPGQPQPSFDKQYVRDYLEKIGWDKNPPAPKLPDEIVKGTSAKYLEAYSLLVGENLS
ncbi:MAG: phosphoribosylaminoimidazolesuccinocarboxamide synthase [Bacteroidota bacterium]|nr:phosphoribosylaminoimidazolesuccinocarboxamide synthase [Bacteroidota bacterium]